MQVVASSCADASLAASTPTPSIVVRQASHRSVSKHSEKRAEQLPETADVVVVVSVVGSLASRRNSRRRGRPPFLVVLVLSLVVVAFFLDVCAIFVGVGCRKIVSFFWGLLQNTVPKRKTGNSVFRLENILGLEKTMLRCSSLLGMLEGSCFISSSYRRSMYPKYTSYTVFTRKKRAFHTR